MMSVNEDAAEAEDGDTFINLSTTMMGMGNSPRDHLIRPSDRDHPRADHDDDDAEYLAIVMHASRHHGLSTRRRDTRSAQRIAGAARRFDSPLCQRDFRTLRAAIDGGRWGVATTTTP